MKKPLFILAITAVATQMAFAGFKVPRSVYRMDKLEEAKSEAEEKGKALIFIYTNPGST